MPYWYTASASEALAATSVLYALAGTVEGETGMQAFDPQIGQSVAVDHVEHAAAKYRGVSEYVRTSEGAHPHRT